MKTTVKRFICMFCIMAILCGFSTNTFAYGEGLAFELEALGITSDMKAGQRLNEYVRRDEFANMVAGMIMQQDVAKTLENEVLFTDISESKYKGAINLLAKLGYIAGDGSGKFNPSAYISYTAACKILVCTLGYEPIVQEKNLWNYASVAGNIGITKGIDSGGEYLTFNKVMVMIDNALDIGMMVPMYYNDNISPSYEVDETRTFRSYHSGRYSDGVVRHTGIVTADTSTYLYNAIPNLKDTQIVIEGKIYNYDGIVPKGLVGQIVEYYVTVGTENREVIIALAPTNKNTVNDFMGSQIEKLSKDKVVFKDADSAKYTVKTNYETRIIYNNRIDLKYKLTDIEKNDNFVIRTVDNDDDEIADVVFVYKYTDCIVESVYNETGVITFKNGYTLGNTRSLCLDDEKISFEIYDANGVLKTIDDIFEDDVVSIAMSNDRSMVRVVKGNEPVKGTIISRDGKYLTVDNTEYYCDSRVLIDTMNIGKTITAYINFAGILVDYEVEKTEYNYGYVYLYSNGGNEFNDYSVKMLMPEYISVKQVEGEVDELSGNAAVSNSLFVRNRSVVVYKSESKILFNGKKASAKQVLEAVVDSPVSFEIGTSGKITKIDTIEAIDDIKIHADDVAVNCVSLNNKKYNGNEQLFGGGTGKPFGIKENYTVAFCVPLYKSQKKADVTDEDLLVFAELSNGVGYEANGYEQDPDTFIADVLVVQKNMNADSIIDVVGTSKVGLVTKHSTILDEVTGEELTALTMITDGNEKKYIVAEQRVNQKSLKTLGAGDLVTYTLDGFDKINTVSLLQDNDYYIDYDEYENGKVCSTVTDIKYMHISNTKIRWVNILEISNGKDIKYEYELMVKNPAPVFLIDGKNYYTASFDDIQVGDRVSVIHDVETFNVRAVVINR